MYTALRPTLGAAAVVLFLSCGAGVAHADVDICATASCSGKTTTGTVSAGSASLTLTAAQDFANGQGIRINHAGAATTVGVPTGLGVAPAGTPGLTSYLYQIASFDARCGISAASSAGGISNGSNELSSTNYNDVTFAQGGGATPIGYVVWRSVGGGSYQYLKLVDGVRFYDYGITDAKPDWVPATPTASALAQCHQTTISAGGGTTTLTLDSAATTAASGQQVAHDDSVQLSAAVTALNAAGGGHNLICPGSARIRYLTRPPAITVANANIVGIPGCTFLPVGNGNALAFTGPSLGASYILAASMREGETVAEISAPSGLAVGDYLVIQQAPPGGSASATLGVNHFHASPIAAINGNAITLTDPVPFTVAQAFSTINVGGSFAVGDVVTVNFSGQTPSSVSYRPTASDSLYGVTENLAIAINATYGGTPASGGQAIAAHTQQIGGGGYQIFVYIPQTVTTTMTASTTSTFGAVSYIQNDLATRPTVNKWNPLDGGVGFHNLTVDGSDATGSLAWISYFADEKFKGLTLRNSHFGLGYLTTGANYFVLADDITLINNGSAATGFSVTGDALISQATVVQQTNIRSRGAKSYGLRDESGGYLMAVNRYQSGAQSGAGYRLSAFGGVTLGTTISNNSDLPNYRLTSAVHTGSFSGLLAFGGVRSGCLSHDDTGNVQLRFFGLQTRDCYKDDIELSPQDRNNTYFGSVLGGGLPSVYNLGLAKFMGVNAYDRAGGSGGATYFHGAFGATAAPQPIFWHTN